MTMNEFLEQRNEKIKNHFEEQKKNSGRVAALSETAKKFDLSVHTIDSIIYPRNKDKTKTVPNENNPQQLLQ